MSQVSEFYLEGIKEGRMTFETEGMEHAVDHVANLKATIKGFSASSSVGQMLRGERDFWLNQLKQGKY